MSSQRTLSEYKDTSDQSNSDSSERYKDPDWLQEQYVNERRSAPDIADEVGVTPPAVRYWLNKYNIETRSGSESMLPKDTVKRLKNGKWLREQYVEKCRTVSCIADDLDVSQTPVITWLEKHGIDTRGQSEDRLPNVVFQKLQDEEWIRQQYIQKERSVADIADELGISTTPVKTWLDRHDIEIRSLSEQQLPAGAVAKLSDEDWLYEQYVEHERAAYDIGQEIGVSATPIYQRLREYGIEVRSQSEAHTEGDVGKLHDEEWLQQQYVDERRSMRDIANDVGVSPTTVKKWLNRHDIETRSLSESHLANDDITAKLKDRDWLYEQYIKKRRSAVEIAEEIDSSKTTVQDWLDRHNIQTRSLSQSHLSNDSIAGALKDKDWFYQQYIENRKSAAEIADELNTATSTVKKWIKKHNIETRGPSESSLPAGAVTRLSDAEWLHEQYVVNQRGLHDIADELNISHTAVQTWLNRHDIEIRSGIIECEDLDHIVRSSWELDVARLLRNNDIEYAYEDIKIQLVDGRTYTPDFFTDSYIIELKGWVRTEREPIKSRAAMELFEDREYVVVGAELPCDIHIPWDERDSLVEMISSE